jgi:hypothetical protein
VGKRAAFNNYEVPTAHTSMIEQLKRFAMVEGVENSLLRLCGSGFVNGFVRFVQMDCIYRLAWTKALATISSLDPKLFNYERAHLRIPELS